MSAGLPEAVLVDEKVCEEDELAHDGGEGELSRLSPCPEAFVDGLEVGVEAGGGEGGHVEGTAEVAPAAADSGLALPFSGLAGDRGDAGEAGDGGGLEGSDLWQVGEDGGGADLEMPGTLQRMAALRAISGSAAMRAAMAASIAARSRRMQRRRSACWRRRSGRVRWRARFLAAVRARTRLVRASWSSWRGAWPAGFGTCGAGSTIAAMRAMRRASTRSVLARVPMASAKRRTRAGLSLAQGMAALCRARSSAPC